MHASLAVTGFMAACLVVIVALSGCNRPTEVHASPVPERPSIERRPRVLDESSPARESLPSVARWEKEFEPYSSKSGNGFMKTSNLPKRSEKKSWRRSWPSPGRNSIRPINCSLARNPMARPLSNRPR